MSEWLKADCSLSFRIRAEENGGVCVELRLGVFSEEKNFGTESLAGNFDLRLNETLFSISHREKAPSEQVEKTYLV